MTRPDCTLTLTANAGLIGRLRSLSFTLDAFHDRPSGGFSALTPAMAETALEAARLAGPELLLVTHSHADHYSQALTRRFLDAAPGTKPLLPFETGEESGFARLDHGSVEYVRMTHDGAPPLDRAPNYGFLLRSDGLSLFTAGDANPADAGVTRLIDGLEPDIAVLDFPWITTARGRKALALMRPRRLALIHLPFREDDANGYIPSAERCAERYFAGGGARVLSAFLQTEDFFIGAEPHDA